jgi:putative endonuclease
MPEWSIYLLRCADGSVYTGIATDVSRRISEHEQGKRGAKYLRGRGPFELVYERAVGDRSIATKIEYRVKQLARIEKEDLQRLPSRIDELLNEFRETV